MADESIRIPMDYTLRPAYYDRFQCLMGDCVYNCCQDNWRIAFNKKDYLALKRVNGSPELNATLKSTLRRMKDNNLRMYGEFVPAGGGGHCPLQRLDGLCSLQREKGAEALPEVCRTFPRSGGPMISGFWERSLSPACEAVLDLIWELPDGVAFTSDPLSKKEQGVVRCASTPLRLHFQDIRSQCIDLLQDRRYSLPQRILLMCLTLKELVDGETDIDRWLTRTQALADSPRVVETLHLPESEHALPLFLSANLKVLGTVWDGGDEMFGPVLDQVMHGLGIEPQAGSDLATLSVAPYLTARTRFEENFKDRDYFMENLMVSLFFHLGLPQTDSGENLWKSCVSFCNYYSVYRFMAVMSCRAMAAGDKAELFRMVVYASRKLLHNTSQQASIRDELFQNNSATLAHMAILLSG